MTSYSTKILIVEHNPDDIAIILDELKTSGINVISEVVQTQKQYVKALKHFIPDIILSDYSLPSFSGPEALKIREEKVPDTPFIFVSGSIGEEKSIEYIRSGVTDYVLKDKLFTLTVKVQRALKEAKERQEKYKTERELVLSESLLARAQQLAQLGNWELNFADNILKLSVEGARIFGLSPDQKQLSFESWSSLVHPEDISTVTNTIKESKATLADISYHHRIILRDGTIRHIYSESKFEFDSNGKGIGLYGTMQDVTEKLKIEEQQQFEKRDKEALINGTDDLIWSVSKDFKLIAANNAFIERTKAMAGITLKAGDDLLMTEIVSGEDLIFWQGWYEKVLSGQSLKEEIYTPASKDRKESWADIRLNPVYKEETVVAIACYSRNITEKKIADKKLMQSEMRLAEAQAISHIGNWEINLASNAHYWSDEIYQIFGIAKNEVIPSEETFMSFCHPEDLKNVYEIIDGGFKTHQNISFYFRFIRKDGDIRHSYNEWQFKFDKNGDPEWLLGIFQDVTGRKRAEESNKFKAELLNTIGQAVIATDLDGIINFWNTAAEEIYGWTTNEALGKNVIDVIPAQQTKGQANEIESQVSQGNSWSGELLVQHKNGHTVPVFVTDAPTYDQNHKLSGIISVSADVSDRKKIEAALKKTNERLLVAQEKTQHALNEKDTILESIGDGFFAVDKNWKVTYWNNQAEKLLRISKDVILGYNLWDIFSDSLDSESHRKYHQAIETNTVINFEDYYPVLMKWYEIAAYPSVNGLAVYFKDITDRKLSEINLNELNANLMIQADKLAQSNTELEQFAYVASHDLQEPLRTITSFLRLLEKKYENIIDEKGKKYIDFAVDGSKRMQQIMQDLLEFSKVGWTEDYQEDINLNEIIKEISILFQKQISENSAVISVQELPVIKCYKTPVRQAFQNLISNALKYSRKDIPVKIIISAKTLKDHWQFCVADNGIGIDNEYFDRIFIIFQRLHNKDEFSGTGIGLPVTKKIIEKLGGKIWVESEEGKGSAFYFTIAKGNIGL